MAIYKDKNRTKDGRLYFFQVMKNGELYKSKRYSTRKEAQKEEALFLLAKSHSSKKFSIVAEAYFKNLETYCKYSTIYTYRKDYDKHILPYFSHFNINSINILIYNKWYEKMSKKGLSVKFLNKVNSLLKNIFQYAVESFGLEYNPVVRTFKESHSQIKIEKIRYITKEEFEKFISVVDDDMYKLFFEFLFYTGVRKGEALCLTWNDINLETKVVSITKTLYKIHNNTPTSNKTHTNRQIFLPNALVENLLSYKANRKMYKDFSDNWYVFGDVFTLSTTTIERKKHHYFELSGVHEISIHEFRHSHVSMLINEYLKTNTDSTKFFLMMSERLGHTVGVMQRTYMHLFPSSQDTILELLNK